MGDRGQNHSTKPTGGSKSTPKTRRTLHKDTHSSSGMAPQYMDPTISGGIMISPSRITNAIPRPKSPRQPEYRGEERRSSFPASESFFKAYTSKIPNVSTRRRPHGEMGRFSPDVDIPHATESRMCVPMSTMGGLLSFNQNAAACIGKSTDLSDEYTKKYGPTAKKKIAVFVNKTEFAAGMAGEGFADFAMTAAEVYRQECKSDNRGGDADFFKKAASAEENSLTEHSPNAERRDSDSNSPARARGITASEPGPFNSKKSMRFPEAIHIMKDPAADLDISPPRVDRMDTRGFHPHQYAQKQAQNNGDLREARMELFRLDQDGVPQVEVRLTRALEDLERQDKAIDDWKMQLQLTQHQLDETHNELHKIKAQSQEKQYKATEIRARAVQQQKRLEDMYEKEVAQNTKLQDTLSRIQVEVSTLKMGLRTTRAEVQRNPQSPPQKDDASTSAQFISLRTEIVDLRSQLAEAHAANLEDTSSLNTNGEIEELKRKLLETESGLAELREKELDAQKLEDNHSKAETMWQEKIELIETAAKASNAKLEESLNTSVGSENQARSELIKVKANMQRLERERSRKRLHSAADVDRLNTQLRKATDEVSKLQKELSGEEDSGKEGSAKLKKELDEVQLKLSSLNQDAVNKNTEALEIRHRHVKDLAVQNQELKDLQQELKSKSERLTSQAERISELEIKLRKSGSKHVGASENNQQISLLENEIKFRKANEVSLHEDLKLQKSLLAKTRSAFATVESSTGNLKTLDESNVGHLRRQLEHFKNPSNHEEVNAALRKEIKDLEEKVASLEAAAKLQADEKPELKIKAMDQSFKNAMGLLKARLDESEAKVKEERFRAEEERRISRENEAKRVEELEELRQEKEKTFEEKLKLRDELLELRRPLTLSASGGDFSTATFKTEDSELPSNVKRLRTELALARARLAAARDHPRSLDERSLSSMPHHSLSESMEEKPLPPLPGSPDKSLESEYESSHESQESHGSWWAPPEFKSTIRADGFMTPPKSVIMNKSKALVDPARSQPVPPTEVTQAAAVATPGKARMEELRRQLKESSQRLQQANSKLNGANSKLSGLVDTTEVKQANTIKPVSSPKSPESPHYIDRVTLLTIVRAEYNEAGVIDEVSSSASGSIEVNQRRFADI